MKAFLFEKYGPAEVLHLAQLDKPVPKANEILIKVFATTVTAGDWKTRRGEPFVIRFLLGLLKPKKNILGFEFAGEIESAGKAVTLFKKGDHIFGTSVSGGAYAEYFCIEETGVVAIKPTNLSYDEAAAGSSGAVAAFQGLGIGKIQSGQKVLINGASGSLGSFAVQLAKSFGAEVTGVCSTSNVELVQSLGADAVIDYTMQNFTESGKQYDIIFDTVGKSSFAACKRSLSNRGIYISSWPSAPLIVQVVWTSILGKKKARIMTETPSLKSLTIIKELLESGKIIPVIDRRYPLEQLVEAHQYVEQGHKKGNVVINIAHTD